MQRRARLPQAPSLLLPAPQSHSWQGREEDEEEEEGVCAPPSGLSALSQPVPPGARRDGQMASGGWSRDTALSGAGCPRGTSQPFPPLLHTRDSPSNQIFLSGCGQRSPLAGASSAAAGFLSQFGGAVTEGPGLAAPPGQSSAPALGKARRDGQPMSPARFIGMHSQAQTKAHGRILCRAGPGAAVEFALFHSHNPPG